MKLSYDFRNPTHLYHENGIVKSHLADMIHTNTCMHCRKRNEILVNNLDFSRWRDAGEYIQDVFTWLTTDEREVLQTGIHPKCWEQLFPESD